MNTADHGGEKADDLLAEAIVDDAVRRRRAQGWDRRRALDDVDVASTLSENVGGQVELAAATGEELRGTLTFAGARVVHLEAVAATHWIRADAVVAVAPTSGRLAGPSGTTSADGGGDAGSEAPAAAPPAASDLPLASLLADLVDDDRSVELHLSGGVVLIGVVEAVGRSVVVSDPTGERCVIAPESVLSVTLPA